MGKWALRAGYGVFYDRTLNGIWEQNAFDDPPLVQTSAINNNGTVQQQYIRQCARTEQQPPHR